MKRQRDRRGDGTVWILNMCRFFTKNVWKCPAIKPDGIYVDGTLGGAGHAFGIGSRLSEKGILIGIDRDKEAIKAAEKRLESLSCTKFLVQSTYDQIEDVLTQLQIDGIDGALLDIGVSSYQLDNGERGFPICMMHRWICG